MALFIPYKFDDPRGRFLNWDTTQNLQGQKAYLATQEHVDLRVMLGEDLTMPRPLGNLEQVEQIDLESGPGYSPLWRMEERIRTVGDRWEKTGTGFDGMTVGPVTAKSNMRLMTLNTSGAAIATNLVSSIAVDTSVPGTAGVDISSQDFLSIVIAGDIDRSGFTQATSTVQLTSRTDADFAQAAGRSFEVPFTANAGGGVTELRIPLSDFANAGFTLTSVTGIKIHLDRTAPAAGLTVYIGGVRAVSSDWVVRSLDQNTRLQVYENPVTLDTGLTATAAVHLIRGNRDLEDPAPADGVLNVTFTTGGSTGSNYIATAADEASANAVTLYFREIYDDGANTGSWQSATLRWGQAGAWLEVTRVDANGAVLTNVGLTTWNLPQNLERVSPTDPNSGRYMFYMQFIGNKVTVTLYKLDAADAITSTIFQQVFDDEEYTFRQGRVGLTGVFHDRDGYIDDFSAASIGFATATSKVFQSNTPVDGAQLQATFAEDTNMWTSFFATDLFLDMNKTTTGRGSYSSARQLMTNQFVLEDWLNTYIEFDLWVPITVSETNQPELSLVGAGATIKPEMPILRGGQWNHLIFTLEDYVDFLTGVPYVAAIEPRQRDLQLGTFWVDNMKIMRRLISWQIRARSDAPWREFRGLVNDPDSAVHLPLPERGTQLQLQAVALREDAWIGSYHLFPHYAELGLPVTDLGYETR